MKEKLGGRQSIDDKYELALTQVNQMKDQLTKLQAFVKANVDQWKGRLLLLLFCAGYRVSVDQPVSHIPLQRRPRRVFLSQRRLRSDSRLVSCHVMC